MTGAPEHQFRKKVGCVLCFCVLQYFFASNLASFPFTISHCVPCTFTYLLNHIKIQYTASYLLTIKSQNQHSVMQHGAISRLISPTKRATTGEGFGATTGWGRGRRQTITPTPKTRNLDIVGSELSTYYLQFTSPRICQKRATEWAGILALQNADRAPGQASELARTTLKWQNDIVDISVIQADS